MAYYNARASTKNNDTWRASRRIDTSPSAWRDKRSPERTVKRLASPVLNREYGYNRWERSPQRSPPAGNRYGDRDRRRFSRERDNGLEIKCLIKMMKSVEKYVGKILG